MLDTRVTGELLAEARKSGATLILAGDDRQLASIERGGLFTELRQRHGAAEISEVTRQQSDWQRQAARDLAEGRFAAAVAAFDQAGAISWTQDQAEARMALVAAWKRDTAANPAATRFVFAYTNKDVDALNAELRQVRRDRGELAGPDVRFDTKHGLTDFAPGDRVQFTATDKRLHIYNGNFVEHRIGDRRIIRLIQKWLKAGILEDEVVTVSERGTGQGSVISPLLANIYLHYAFDLWANRWRQREATGDMIVVRYADDIVVGFEHEADARRFLDMMRARLEEFALTLHPEKTRLIEFGRHAAVRREKRGESRPETFNFLGFTMICGKSRRGKFLLWRKSRRDRLRTKLLAVKEELRRRMHQPIPRQGEWLRSVVGGWFNYHAVPTNSRSLQTFRDCVVRLWLRALRRRGQRDKTTWERMQRLADDYLPKPRILHPWPEQRFAVKHPRWEPYAGMPHVRLCAGARGNARPYRDCTMSSRVT